MYGQTSFTIPPILSERFAHTASTQYYSILPSLTELVTYIQQKICSQSSAECLRYAELLHSVDTLDIDYDSISHSLRIDAYWSWREGTSKRWTEAISTTGSDPVEVGVLSSEDASDPFELSLSGFLTVVGDDEKPAPTLFSFPSRHHPLPQSQRQQQQFKISFAEPTGLHPTLCISFPSAKDLNPPSTKPLSSACSLHSYLTLPSYLFPDQYQLSTSDPLFLSSNNLVSLRAISGELDLEAPDYATTKWGSNVLLELSTPAFTTSTFAQDTPWNVTIPLHLRYLPPNPTGYTSIQIPNPIVFWACSAEEGTKFPVNPFDRVNLGWDGLFGERTMFYQLEDLGNTSWNVTDPSRLHVSLSQPQRTKTQSQAQTQSRLIQQIRVPVLQTEDTIFTPAVIEFGTVTVISLGFLWIIFKLLNGLRPSSSGSTGTTTTTTTSSKGESGAKGHDTISSEKKVQ